nr:GMP/IMP nucleotidase [Aliikangiella sp. G2MR2-5]
MVDWSLIDTVLLDMDGTILDLAFDNYFWLEFMPTVYAKKNALSLEESKLYLANSYGAIEGKLQWYCLDFWSDRLQLDIPELKQSVGERVSFRTGAVEFLSFLNKMNKKVYLVTNAHPKSLEIKMLNADFHQYFNDLSSSHEFGFPKEEQAYWLALESRYGFDKHRTLFIDDSESILESAQNYGIKRVLGILQPDSTRPPIEHSRFERINNFLRFINNE